MRDRIKTPHIFSMTSGGIFFFLSPFSAIMNVTRDCKLRLLEPLLFVTLHVLFRLNPNKH